MEGPSLILLREQSAKFKGKRILQVAGNSRIGIDRLGHCMLRDIRTWGKHFVLCFDGFLLRVHFLMFGSYTIDAQKEKPRLSLTFLNGSLHFYNCSLKFLEGRFEEHYQEETDVMSPRWDAKKASRTLAKLKAGEPVCDALLNQDIFSGVGNIIKNEVLFRESMHPLTAVASLNPKQRMRLVNAATAYSHDFLAWRRKHELRKHWEVYKKKTCPVCGGRITRTWLGHPERLTFFCTRCQQ